ncbi:hypothetical protein M3182_12830 [Mesobacillus maritimus]|uniref:hypothetical protein n=1 Tax=Mesobacillus maritimus TaxID=1643336 RepID=UPI00203E6B83|nr:hypothetical protein [Mesobacillus maritimus]MCM3586617.1 hypothetical protein [Mesobacillus maritimus]MCM3668629.1 hypothetical protein [Mesobacillus maritimus]
MLKRASEERALEALINESNKVKKELDQTQITDEKRFTNLLKRLLKIHQDMNSILN